LPGTGTVGIETPPNPIVTGLSLKSLDMRYAGVWYILRYVTEQYMVNVELSSSVGCDTPTIITAGGSIETVLGKQFTYPRDDIWSPFQCYRDMYMGPFIDSDACQRANRSYKEHNANARVGAGAGGVAGIYAYGETGMSYKPGNIQNAEAVSELGLQVEVGPVGFNSGTTGGSRVHEFSISKGADAGVCSAGTGHTFGIEAPNELFVIVPAARYHALNESEVALRTSDYRQLVPSYYKYAGILYETDATTYANETSGKRLVLAAVRTPRIGGNVRSPYGQHQDGVHPTPLNPYYVPSVCFGP